jgi:hypothetical protein
VSRRPLEVADIVRAHRTDLERSRGQLLASESSVLNAIAACRTDALGGHVERCDDCGHQRIAYNSCRNRHCPKCLMGAREEWLREREADLLPIEYYHVVFTLPHEISVLASQNKRMIYGLLFKAASSSLLTLARDPKRMGVELGVLAILHTWGQSLEHHPHVHCVVTGGGLSLDGERWVASRRGFLLPVRLLSRLFRGRFLAGIKRAHQRGELGFHGSIAELEDTRRFDLWLKALYRHEWVVYAKAPFGGPSRVLKYLGRYTHRVAISNQRLVAMKDGNVSFLWKDYAHGCRRRVMTLSAVEFLRRFLMHVLPKGFVRIRHYGFLANRCRERKLERCRRLLAVKSQDAAPPDAASMNASRPPCPACGHAMRIVLRFEAGEQPCIARAAGPQDTS